MRGQQFHHQREERRLRAAQVIAAVTVRDMAPGIKLVSEVVHHVADLIPVAALGQPQHGEIAVPVIDFAEASPRHDIGFWQGKKRVPFVRFVGGAGQHRPQIVYVFAQALALRGNVFLTFLRQDKVHLHEVAQVKTGLGMLHPVIREDR